MITTQSAGISKSTHRLITNKSTWQIGQVAYGLYLGEFPFNGKLAAAYMVNNGNDVEFRIDLDHDLWLFGKVKKHVSVVTSSRDVLFVIDGSDHDKKQPWPFPVEYKDHKPVMLEQQQAQQVSDDDWSKAVMSALSSKEDGLF